MKGYDLKQTKLSKKQADIILNHLPKRTQASRIFEYLYQYAPVKTGVLCAKTSTFNISHTVKNSINPAIEPFGLVVACERPEIPYKNQFGSITSEYDWALYELNEPIKACK